MKHQHFDTHKVFTGQPISHFPEHDTINIAEYTGPKINELIERSQPFSFRLSISTISILLSL